MRCSDEAIIISVRSHGEAAAIVEVFTRNYGRILGFFYGGQSRKQRALLQIGNHVDIVWHARLSQHLGRIQLELRTSYAARVIEDFSGLAMLASMTALMRFIPERDPHIKLFDISIFVLNFLNNLSVWPALYVRWELTLLDELGYGLDLESCAATQARENLVYVSPRSGNAISYEVGMPYKDKLLPLPQFLLGNHTSVPSVDEILDGLKLTGFFLAARLRNQQGCLVHDARKRLVTLLQSSIVKVA
ncbi:MAG: DNA repair protein RecO [Hyphomicrobiaceae bacterium]|nr:DNA repair protein RecO [Hyphomicrobiaceae bacterium]